MLAEDKLETQEIVIEPEEVKAQPDGWKKRQWVVGWNKRLSC